MTDAPWPSQQTNPIPIRPVPAPRPAALPRPLTSFVGRERERLEIGALLTGGETQLLTLVGPAGVGKTRLAVHVARELQFAFAIAGFASLAPAIDPDQIVPATGEALGIREPDIDRIGARLGTLPALLVLDNLEQIPGAGGVLARLLAACPSLTVLATSRSVLRISGERVYPILPFTVDPDPNTRLGATAAVQLFATRAREAGSAFSLDEANTEVIASICRQVDGLPLAIELAAAQVRVLSPRAILARLDRRLEMLTHGPQDQPARLQSLERAIRWSYDLLSPAEQKVFRYLSVFAGGFSEDAVRQIALAGSPALAVVANLLDASLLVRTTQPDGESRYALLETIREFSLLELQAHGEESAARQAHSSYYLQLATRAEPRLIVAGSAEWVRHLTVEQANLRDAVEWSLAAGMPEPVLDLAGTLLSMAYAQGEPAESLFWLERAIDMTGPCTTQSIADALFSASALAQVEGNFARAVGHATSSLHIARAIDYPFGVGRALLGLGISAEWEYHLDLAEEHYRGAHAVMRTLDASTRLAHWRVLPLANLADIALIRGRYREAIELGSEAVTAWRDAGYLWGIAQALGTVAAAHSELDQLDDARRDYRETLDVWIACADGRGIAGTIAGVAAVAARAGDSLGAASLLGAAWNARATLGLEFVTHHLYAEQVRASVLARARSDPQLAAAELRGRTSSLDEAVAAARAVLAAPGGRERASSPLALSAREREVLACIVEGMHDREIAERLSISPRTVQSHVLGILNKLGAHSRAEAVAIGIRNGLL